MRFTSFPSFIGSLVVPLALLALTAPPTNFASAAAAVVDMEANADNQSRSSGRESIARHSQWLNDKFGSNLQQSQSQLQNQNQQFQKTRRDQSADSTADLTFVTDPLGTQFTFAEMDEFEAEIRVFESNTSNADPTFSELISPKSVFINQCVDVIVSLGKDDDLISQNDATEFLVDFCISVGECDAGYTTSFQALNHRLQLSFTRFVCPFVENGPQDQVCLDELEAQGDQFGYVIKADENMTVLEDKVRGMCFLFWKFGTGFHGGTESPTMGPSGSPSLEPSGIPSVSPTWFPSAAPTVSPTFVPTSSPSSLPTFVPSVEPSSGPTGMPSLGPSSNPSGLPTLTPSSSPSGLPTLTPSSSPSGSPTLTPSSSPSGSPTAGPSSSPSSSPTLTPSSSPTNVPSASPSKSPTAVPSSSPTLSQLPTSAPTQKPSFLGSFHPSVSSKPSHVPTSSPSSSPTTEPTLMPSTSPTNSPSGSPSRSPTTGPTSVPSMDPSSGPTVMPSSAPYGTPSLLPVASPSSSPSASPSNLPTGIPSSTPSSTPSSFPTTMPSSVPSMSPSSLPSSEPSHRPSLPPGVSMAPSSTPTFTPSSTPTSSQAPTLSQQPSSSPSQTVVFRVDFTYIIGFNNTSITARSLDDATKDIQIMDEIRQTIVGVLALDGIFRRQLRSQLQLDLHVSGSRELTIGFRGQSISAVFHKRLADEESCPESFTASLSCVRVVSEAIVYANPETYSRTQVQNSVRGPIKESMDGNPSEFVELMDVNSLREVKYVGGGSIVGDPLDQNDSDRNPIVSSGGVAGIAVGAIFLVAAIALFVATRSRADDDREEPPEIQSSDESYNSDLDPEIEVPTGGMKGLAIVEGTEKDPLMDPLDTTHAHQIDIETGAAILPVVTSGGDNDSDGSSKYSGSDEESGILIGRLDAAVSAGDWAAVAAIAGDLSTADEASSMSSVNTSKYSNTAEKYGLDAANKKRAATIDQLIAEGDWNAVGATAAAFDDGSSSGASSSMKSEKNSEMSSKNISSNDGTKKSIIDFIAGPWQSSAASKAMVNDHDDANPEDLNISTRKSCCDFLSFVKHARVFNLFVSQSLSFMNYFIEQQNRMPFHHYLAESALTV